MRVDWISLVDYRSYSGLEWSPAPGMNLLIGDNGAGKTNLLESIGYLSTLKSFRSAPDSALITTNAETAVIRAGITGRERDRLVEIEISRNAPRRCQVDKTRLTRSSDLLGVIRVVSFLPEDIDLVKRGPALRRDLLDDVAVQLWPAASLDQSEYERALRQRNAFLKSGARDPDSLSVWDSRLALAGGRVVARRSRVLEVLGPLLQSAHEEIAGPEAGIGLDYQPTWTDEGLGLRSAADYTAAIDRGLEHSRRQDYERRMTTVGPHRDEPSFLISDTPARTHASQGEQRSIALAIRIATHRAIAESTGEQPVLVLDDVFSELDHHRSEALAKTLPSETQTIISSARPDDVPLAGSTFVVSEGTLR